MAFVVIHFGGPGRYDASVYQRTPKLGPYLRDPTNPRYQNFTDPYVDTVLHCVLLRSKDDGGHKELVLGVDGDLVEYPCRSHELRQRSWTGHVM